MKVPLAGIHERSIVDLRNDPYADPEGNNDLFSKLLVVRDNYQGSPKRSDLRSAYDFNFLGKPAGPDEEDVGNTMVFTQQGDSKIFLLYFPSDQHEVELIDDDEEDF